MADTLFFVHASEHDPLVLARMYELHGWDVAVSEPHAADALERMAVAGPVAAVFCLDGECAGEVGAFAEAVLADDRTRSPLMVFVGGTADEIDAARAVAPYGIFVRSDELPWVLKHLNMKL